MPKDFFKLENVTRLPEPDSNYKIHFIGVCGVAMAQLAVTLAKMGYSVCGSDKEFYEPMGSYLRNNNIKTYKGYSGDNIAENIDLVVIGNAISYGNPEVDVVEQRNLPYTYFSRLLDETIIQDKTSIAICGTHGKTTTTAMVASILVETGGDPSYFVGGISLNLPESLHFGAGKFSVVEGDEYDSVFFYKVAKFFDYHPDVCVVNAIEFDHGDLYPDVQAIMDAFTRMINAMPETGTTIACIDFENVKKCVAEWKKTAKCKIITFGASENADWRIVKRETVSPNKQNITVEVPKLGKITFSIPLIGEFNARNALAAIIATYINGVSIEQATKVLSGYKSVKRRQEIRYEGNGITIIEDFAKHPTNVREIITSLREAYPDKRIWAVFEPRTNTSRRKFFQKDYVDGFKNADEVIISHIEYRAIDEGEQLINVAELSDDINASGISSRVLENADTIKAYLVDNIKSGDVVVIMSNGGFGGLVQKLTEHYV